jgi:hypothetical protein
VIRRFRPADHGDIVIRETGTEGLSVVNKVTWQKAGRVTEPGRYMFRYGWLTITAEDLAIWRQFPEASFTLVNLPSSPDAPEEFHLGAFEIPASPSLDEH